MQVNNVPNKLLYISKHAILRYQQRIENAKPEEVIRRLRKMMEPHRKAAEGHWSFETRKCGPACKIQFTVNPDGSAVVTSVYCVTDAQKTRALVDRNWV